MGGRRSKSIKSRVDSSREGVVVRGGALLCRAVILQRVG